MHAVQSQLTIKKLSKGSIYWFTKDESGKYRLRQEGNLVASIWNDSKPVTKLSTLADPVEHTTVMRKQKDGRSIIITCHQAVKIYNQFMGGVDKGDQLRGYYKVRLKSIKIISTFLGFCSMCASQMHTYYHITMSTVTNQYLNHSKPSGWSFQLSLLALTSHRSVQEGQVALPQNYYHQHFLT